MNKIIIILAIVASLLMQEVIGFIKYNQANSFAYNLTANDDMPAQDEDAQTNDEEAAGECFKSVDHFKKIDTYYTNKYSLYSISYAKGCKYILQNDKLICFYTPNVETPPPNC